jgi:hypothetical protein
MLMQKLLDAPASSVVNTNSPKMAEKKKVIKIKRVIKDGSAAKRYAQESDESPAQIIEEEAPPKEQQVDAFQNIEDKFFEIIESEEVQDVVDLNEKFLSA